MFPHQPPTQAMEQVHTFITMGCPAELVRTYWHKYFQGRYRHTSAPDRWINIFFPSDPLASNFIDGDTYAVVPPSPRRRRPTKQFPDREWSGVQSRLRPGDIAEDKHPDENVRHMLDSSSGGPGFNVATLRAHTSYWHRSDIHAASVFDTVVQQLFL